jgi:hypothetical protein
MASSDEHVRLRAWRLAGPEWIALRLCAYALMAALLTETLVTAAAKGWFASIGSEGGPIESVQYLLCATAVVFFAAASRRSRLRDVFALVAYGAALAVIREADAFFDHLAFHGAYKIPAALIGAIALGRAYRVRATLVNQIGEWMTTPGFAMTASGAFLVLIYAQIVGQKELWQSLMGAAYLRPVKDVAEEMQELAGYLLIFFGATESYLYSFVCGPRSSVAGNSGLERSPSSSS